MYSPQNVAWWTARSSSIGYQKAYDNIVSYLSIDPQFVYIDVACGKGEILKRLYEKGQYGALVGTDGSCPMLEAAQDNLKDYDFQIKDVTSLEGVNRGSRILVLDNLLECKVQNGLADVTIFTFPELRGERNPSPIDTMNMERYVSKFGDFDRKYYSDALDGLRLKYHLARVTKCGGQIAVAKYDISWSKKTGYSGYALARFKTESEAWALFDVKVKSQSFFESPEIWDGTIDDSERGHRLKGAKEGYRLYFMRKC